MTNEIKKELAAFLRDYKEMCKKTGCGECPMKGRACGLNERFDTDRALAAVEAWREKRKPKPEVIDKALDIYTIEAQRERERPMLKVDQYVSMCDIIDDLKRLGYTITDFKAQRFVLESHKEDPE